MIYDSTESFRDRLPSVIPGLARLKPLLEALERWESFLREQHD